MKTDSSLVHWPMPFGDYSNGVPSTHYSQTLIFRQEVFVWMSIYVCDKMLAHVKTECNYGESVEGGARCPAYGF